MQKVLHSKILGEGNPLFVLHGFLGMSDNWKTLGAQYASHGFEVHLIDQRNHGKSFHSQRFDYGVLAEDIKDYMNFHHIEKTTIIGHSMGGKTAMQLAVAHSDLITKLIVADIAPKYYPPHHQEIIDALQKLDFDQIKNRKQADTVLSQHLSSAAIRQFLLKNLFWVEKERLGLRFNLQVLRYKMEEIGENIDGSSVYLGPTLFLRGDRSEYVQNYDTPIINRYFPNATMTTIENAGHWLHAENPKQFLEKSLDFLNR
ncbi:MAG: alpha/beta fold hydrolase [Bacteroidota bacterium]